MKTLASPHFAGTFFIPAGNGDQTAWNDQTIQALRNNKDVTYQYTYAAGRDEQGETPAFYVFTAPHRLTDELLKQTAPTGPLFEQETVGDSTNPLTRIFNESALQVFRNRMPAPLSPVQTANVNRTLGTLNNRLAELETALDQNNGQFPSDWEYQQLRPFNPIYRLRRQTPAQIGSWTLPWKTTQEEIYVELMRGSLHTTVEKLVYKNQDTLPQTVTLKSSNDNRALNSLGFKISSLITHRQDILNNIRDREITQKALHDFETLTVGNPRRYPVRYTSPNRGGPRNQLFETTVTRLKSGNLEIEGDWSFKHAPYAPSRFKVTMDPQGMIQKAECKRSGKFATFGLEKPEFAKAAFVDFFEIYFKSSY